MKLYFTILAWACLFPAAAFAAAETPRSVSVPAGELVDALESLAKQCGVDVIYPSSQLKGLKTQGIHGAFKPMEAFKTLLEGTPLVLREVGGALLVAQAESASQPAAAQVLSEVEIEAQFENCRQFLMPGDEKKPILCGNASQWAELERQVTSRNAGVTCRRFPAQVICQNARQWKIFDRQGEIRKRVLEPAFNGDGLSQSAAELQSRSEASGMPLGDVCCRPDLP